MSQGDRKSIRELANGSSMDRCKPGDMVPHSKPKEVLWNSLRAEQKRRKAVISKVKLEEGPQRE